MKRALRVHRTGGTFEALAEAPFDVAEFLGQPLVARVATAGSVVRPVWYLWEDEVFWVLVGPWSSLGNRLATDPLFELVVDTCDIATGLARQVIARGRGEITRVDNERGRRKLCRYLGEREANWDNRFSLRDDHWERGIRWAKLVPDTLLISDLSFQPSFREPDGPAHD